MFGMKEALSVLRIISKNVKKGDSMEVVTEKRGSTYTTYVSSKSGKCANCVPSMKHDSCDVNKVLQEHDTFVKGLN